MIAGCKAIWDDRNPPGKLVFFGDMTPLPLDIIDDIYDFMMENGFSFKWNPGNFVIIDNTVSYHSR